MLSTAYSRVWVVGFEFRGLRVESGQHCGLLLQPQRELGEGKFVIFDLGFHLGAPKSRHFEFLDCKIYNIILDFIFRVLTV